MTKQIGIAARNVLENNGVSEKIKEQQQKEVNVTSSDSESISINTINKETPDEQ